MSNLPLGALSSSLHRVRVNSHAVHLGALLHRERPTFGFECVKGQDIKSVNRSGSVRSSYKHPTISNCITKMRSLLSTQPLNLICQKTYRPKLSADSDKPDLNLWPCLRPTLVVHIFGLCKDLGPCEAHQFRHKNFSLQNLQNLLRSLILKSQAFRYLSSLNPATTGHCSRTSFKALSNLT